MSSLSREVDDDSGENTENGGKEEKLLPSVVVRNILRPGEAEGCRNTRDKREHSSEERRDAREAGEIRNVKSDQDGDRDSDLPVVECEDSHKTIFGMSENSHRTPPGYSVLGPNELYR